MFKPEIVVIVKIVSTSDKHLAGAIRHNIVSEISSECSRHSINGHDISRDASYLTASRRHDKCAGHSYISMIVGIYTHYSFLQNFQDTGECYHSLSRIPKEQD